MADDSLYIGDRVQYVGGGANRAPRPGTVIGIDFDKKRPFEVEWDAVTAGGPKTITRYNHVDLRKIEEEKMRFSVGDPVHSVPQHGSERRGTIRAGRKCAWARRCRHIPPT